MRVGSRSQVAVWKKDVIKNFSPLDTPKTINLISISGVFTKMTTSTDCDDDAALDGIPAIRESTSHFRNLHSDLRSFVCSKAKGALLDRGRRTTNYEMGRRRAAMYNR